MPRTRRGESIVTLIGAVLLSSQTIGASHAQDVTEQRETVARDGRNYVVRQHGMPPVRSGGGFQALLPPAGISGWRIVGGNAAISRENETLRGVGSASRNTFLLSNAEYGDFVLEGEVMINPGGNSGWQVRSRPARPGERTSGVRGYQLEVDSSDRRWSGGLYDELRRGWIHSLADDDDAQAAFRTQDWNHYRIECLGPHIRSWVNGVPCADVIDFADLDGSIAFQVHSGNCDVRWRNLRIQEIGSTSWIDAGPWKPNRAFTNLPDGGIRISASAKPVSIQAPLPGAGTTLRLHYVLDGEARIAIRPFNQAKDGLVVHLDSKDAGRDGTISGQPLVSSAYPVTAPSAGTNGAPGDAREIIIDVEGPRVTVLIDGQVVQRAHADSNLRADMVEIEVPPGENSIDLIDAEVCVREIPAARNTSGKRATQSSVDDDD